MRWQCERESVWIRMKLYSKRESWMISSKRKEDRAVRNRLVKMEAKTREWFASGEGALWLDDSSEQTLDGLRMAIHHIMHRQKELGKRLKSETVTSALLLPCNGDLHSPTSVLVQS